jgi:hypothetical protein
MLLRKELADYNRYQAFAVHMAISLAIFFILLVCITQYWYPGILFDTGNGWKAIGLIIGIDLILGPLLTLIVFNPLKSSIKFDLSVVAIVQIAALTYGSWTIYQTRPIAIAFINTSFMTIFANSELAQQLNSRITELNTNQLYYQFNDKKEEEKELHVDSFSSYDQESEKVIEITSPYITHHNESSSKVNIDPLVSSNRYLLISRQDGSILGFYESQN